MMSLDVTRCEVLRQAIEKGFLSPSEPLALFFDLDYFEKVLTEFQEAFKVASNVNFLHCYAVKAAPFPKLIQLLPRINFGAEAASLTEVEIALRSGIEPCRIVWDSPCKTMDEIRFGLSRKINMNADNVQELERYQQVVQELNLGSGDSLPKYLGLRLNPCVGMGEKAATSTADIFSKFGIPISLYREEALDCFRAYHWLNTLHFHIGSQAFGLPGLVEAVRIIFEFAEEVNAHFGHQRVAAIDIGGGLPTLYDSDDYDAQLGSFAEFVNQIKQEVSGILSGKYVILTENGRVLSSKSGWAVARIEYVKQVEQVRIVTQHIGADLLLRTCYLPDDWPMRMFVCNSDGSYKSPAPLHPDVLCDVAGPLCFGGDKIARRRLLVDPKQGDWLIVCDTGGYTVSLWNRHCSRPCPAIYQFRRRSSSPADPIEFSLMKKKETVDQVISFYE